MTIIVNDSGFHSDDIPQSAPMLYIAADTNPTNMGVPDENTLLVCVDFPSFADGRGFTLARHLRQLGYTGRLRAMGHLIADQYTMARRAGFDEVEISDDLATRQPWPQWQARTDWQAHDYQSRLGHTL
ncbi:MAG: DUF934 domain-containing protein [Paracoccaceae bacterium]